MKDFLKKVVEGSGVSPSVVCLKSFTDNFEDAINVEWFRRDGCFEAVFYRNNLEHIALFSLNGMLKEYKKNLPPEYLPEAIKNLALSKGEIMNAVLKNKGNCLEYELIFRDASLKRHLLTLSDAGELKEEIRL